jgi:Bacteriophage Sf6, terminase small subunit-like
MTLCLNALLGERRVDASRVFRPSSKTADHTPEGATPMPDPVSSRVRDALHRVDADAVRGSDHAHAWAILPAQRGVDRSLDVGSDLGPAQLLALVLGPPQAGAHPLLDHGPLELGEHAHHLEHGPAGRRRGVQALLVKEEVDAQRVQLTEERHETLFLRDTRAREAQADLFFKECLEIADRGKDSENESQARIQRDRLRVDTRKWMAARLAPKKYGDHLSHDVKGVSNNFQPQILIQCSSGGEDEGYLELHATSEAADSLPQQGNGNSLPRSGGRR